MIINIKQIKEEDMLKAGIKACGLARLSSEFNIAPGYVLTSAFFERFIDENQFRTKIRNLLAIIDPDDEERLENVANEIQKLILSGNLTEDMIESLLEAYYSLNIKGSTPLSQMVESDEEPIVVVRASPVHDADTLSIIHVQGKEKLLKSVVLVFASLYSAASIRKRHIEGIKDATLGVLIQKMIIPHISGYIEENDEGIIVRACYGLSDDNTNFDKYVVKDMKLKTSVVERQKQAFMKDSESGKLAKVTLPEAKGDNAKLQEKQVIVLSKLWNKANLLGQQVEFIIDKDNYYFVQVKNMEEEEKKEKKDNTVFSLFNANREGTPDIPTEPRREQPAEEKVPEEPAPEEPAREEPEAPEEPVREEPEAPEEPVREEPEAPQETPEPATEEPQVAEYTEPAQPEEDTSTREEPPVVEYGDEPQTPAEPQAAESTGIIEEPEEVNMEEQPVMDLPGKEMDIASSDVHPLAKEEWLNTLNMEHTKVLLNYDLVIATALKRRYSKIFSKEPESFLEMIEELKGRVNIPYEEQVKGIHAMRNHFLKEHKTVSINELKVAFEITENFLNEFQA